MTINQILNKHRINSLTEIQNAAVNELKKFFKVTKSKILFSRSSNEFIFELIIVVASKKYKLKYFEGDDKLSLYLEKYYNEYVTLGKLQSQILREIKKYNWENEQAAAAAAANKVVRKSPAKKLKGETPHELEVDSADRFDAKSALNGNCISYTFVESGMTSDSYFFKTKADKEKAFKLFNKRKLIIY